MASPDRDEKLQFDFAQAVRQMKENMPAMLEYEGLRARVAMRRFQELVAVGFTPVQALDIVAKGYQ